MMGNPGKPRPAHYRATVIIEKILQAPNGEEVAEELAAFTVRANGVATLKEQITSSAGVVEDIPGDLA